MIPKHLKPIKRGDILEKDAGLALPRTKKAPKEMKDKTPKEKKKRGSDPLKTILRKCDREFSAFIRNRDCPGGFGPCITCGRVKPYAEMDCGHYLGRQYWATRFDPMNCAAQCRFENRYNEGMKHKFRPALVAKYGEEAIARMEAMHKTGRKPKLIEAQLILERIRSMK